MQHSIWYVTVLFSLGLARAPSAPERPAAQPVDGFAAEVDGKVITVGDVIQRIRPELMGLRNRVQGAALLEAQTRLFEEGLEEQIEEQLMLAKFRKLEAELPAGVVRDRMETVMREQFDDDRAEFQRALEATGTTEREWRDRMRDRLIVQSMRQQFVHSKVHVAPREVREEYERRRDKLSRPVELELRAIAFRPASGDRAERLERKVREVQQRLEDGAAFEDVAKTFSEGPKADQGGYQGWVAVDNLPGSLPQVLTELEPGTVTEWIDTPFQSYIFQVLDRRGGQTRTLAEAQPELEALIRERKREELYETWMDGLRGEFQVRRYNPDISAVTGGS